jgi:ribosomal protein L1
MHEYVVELLVKYKEKECYVDVVVWTEEEDEDEAKQAAVDEFLSGIDIYIENIKQKKEKE